MTELSRVSKYLADNINILRRKRSWSQDQLAKQSEVPRSTVTHLESGDGNPSLKNLIKIAAAFGVSIEELLSRPRNDCHVVVAKDVPVAQRSKGRVRVAKLLPDKILGMEIDRLELDAGLTMVGQPHLQGTKEYFVPLSGRFDVYVAGQKFPLGKGDVFAFPGDQAHSYRNAANSTSTAISVVVPVPTGT